MEFDPNLLIQEAKDAIRRYYHSDHDPLFCLDHARRNFEEALEESSDRALILEALMGLSYTYGYLADVDPSTCTDYARTSVSTAERALSLCQEHFQDKPSIEARVYDTLGCALRQRYVYLGDMKDCDQAIEAQRRSLDLTTLEDSPLSRSVRRSHLVRALYMRSRGSRHDHKAYKKNLLEAVSMTQKYECNGASTPFTMINGGLLFLCGRLWIEGEPMGSSRRVVLQAAGEPQNLKPQLQSTVQAMAANYDIMTRLHGPRFTMVAAELGSFSASLLAPNNPDHTNDLASRVKGMLHNLTDQSFPIDLRQVTLLMDILHTLVTDYGNLPDQPTTNLIKVICQRLHRLLPETHMERPELHFLLGKHLSSGYDESTAHASEFHNANPSRAIVQFQKALGLTPESHPSRAIYLISLISAQLGSLNLSGLISEYSAPRKTLQELIGWADALRSLEQSSNLDSPYRRKLNRTLAVLEQAQDKIEVLPPSEVEAYPSLQGTAQVGVYPSESQHRSSEAHLGDLTQVTEVEPHGTITMEAVMSVACRKYSSESPHHSSEEHPGARIQAAETEQNDVIKTGIVTPVACGTAVLFNQPASFLFRSLLCILVVLGMRLHSGQVYF